MAGVAGALACCGDRPVHAAGTAAPARHRLELTNVHTGETVNVTFSDAHGISPDELARLRHVLRDYRRDEEHDMDPALFVMLSELAQEAGFEPKYEVISGYRSPATNEHLRTTGHAVAEHSMHMEGRAMDVRLKGCPLSRLRDLALAARRGGVGYYPRSGFVHIDTGRVRSWQE